MALFGDDIVGSDGEISRAIKVRVHRVKNAMKAKGVLVELDGMNKGDEFPVPIKEKSRSRVPDRFDDIEEAVDRLLSARERQVVELRFEQGLNLKEIGAHFGLSESRACQLLGVLLGKLKRALVI